MNIFPNPNNSNFSIALFSNFNDVITINIMDIQGKLVENKNNVTIQEGANTIDIVSNLKAGVYTLKIHGNTNSYTKKLLIN